MCRRGVGALPMQALRLALLLVLLAPALLPAAGAKVGHVLTLTSRFEGDALVANVTDYAHAGPLTLVVSPRLGPLIRAVPLDLQPGQSALVRMRDLPWTDRDAQLDVRVVEGRLGTAGFSDLPAEPDPAANPTIAEGAADVPVGFARQPLLAPDVLVANQTPGPGDLNARILATPESLLVTGWVGGGQLFVSSSKDGGRSWGVPTLVGPAKPVSTSILWSMAQASPRQIVIAYQGMAAGAPWTLFSYDPVAQSGSASATILGPAPPDTRQQGAVAIRVMPTTFAAYVASQADAQGNVGLWEVDPNGTYHGLGGVRFAAEVGALHLVADGSRLALVGDVNPANGTMSHLRGSTSTDGGYTWTEPADVSTPTLQADLDFADDAGTVHVAGSVGATIHQAIGETFPLQDQPESPEGTYASEVSLGVRDGLSWTVFMTSDANSGHVVDMAHVSSSRGSATYAMTPQDHVATRVYSGGVGVLPDGRPALLSAGTGVWSRTLFDPRPDAAGVLTKISYGEATSLGALLGIVSLTPDPLVVPANATANVTVRVTNEGDAPARPYLSRLVDELGLDHALNLSGGPWATLPAGATSDLTLQVRAGDAAGLLTNVTFTLRDLDANDSARGAFTVHVASAHAKGLLVLPARVAVRLTPGASTEILVAVSNGGEGPLALGNASLGGQGAVTLAGARFDDETIAPGVTSTMHVRLDAPRGLRDNGTMLLAVRSADGQQGVVELDYEVAPAPPGLGGASPLSAPVGVAAAAVAVAAGASIAALARTDAGRVAGAVAMLPLYTRLAKSDVLQHEVRAGVYAHVLANPGARFGELRRDLGLSNGALVFHLKVLEREGYLSAHREWTRRRYYGTGRVPPAAPATVADAINGLLRSAPGLPLAEVARRLGVSRQLADYHLRRLERARRVRREERGRSPTWFAEEG
ncbi:MAG: hypothetical protein QOE90_1798 [Thermoplasmata archaeon]|jgi:DNA-binding transcriptional ArsR family regulator|nr:hypothetical protein [Thermoplasmata archaeon]